MAVNSNGKLHFSKTGNTEYVIDKLLKLVQMGRDSSISDDKLRDYFDNEIDIECIIELFNRRRYTGLWLERRHDPRYLEKELPMASIDYINYLVEEIKSHIQSCDTEKNSKRIK